MSRGELSPVGGYVLAGGRSSRMGSDKSLLELGGRPLILHAVTKLRRLCAEVSILSSNAALKAYAPIVRDVHEGCGPMGGIEAALRSSRYEWNLILPVDVPFVPTFLLDDWLWSMLHKPGRSLRGSMLFVDSFPQSALLIIHRDIAPYLTASLERGELKLLPALRSAGEKIAAKLNVKSEKVFEEIQWDDPYAPRVKHTSEPWRSITEAQRENVCRWFANLNTPEEFAEAERHLNALDT